jgi:hypothetical protein
MNMKEIFEFLIPNKWNLILTIIVSVVGVFTFWKNMLTEIILNVPPRLYTVLLVSTTMGFLIVSYTLISLVMYLFSGRWKG